MGAGGGYTREEVARLVHGIDPESWRCPACGASFYDAPPLKGACCCGRPLPSRCVECGGPSEPTGMGPYWGVPAGLCESCERTRVTKSREVHLDRIIPREASGFRRYDEWTHRKKADVVIRRWVKTGCGRRGSDLSDQTPGLFLFGQTGSGKSTAAAWAAYLAYAVYGVVSEVTWIREGELFEAHRQSWGAGTAVSREIADAARALTKMAKATELLVLDEFLGEADYSAAFIKLMGEIVTSRIESGRPTIYTSNSRPDLSGHLFRERVQDRFDHAVHVVMVDGKNLRSHYRGEALRRRRGER